MTTLKQLAREAIEIQGTCNLCGLVAAFPAVTANLRHLYPSYETKFYNGHPIVKLWVSKMYDLAGMGLSNVDRYTKAYECCRDIAELEPGELRS